MVMPWPCALIAACAVLAGPIGVAGGALAGTSLGQVVQASGGHVPRHLEFAILGDAEVQARRQLRTSNSSAPTNRPGWRRSLHESEEAELVGNVEHLGYFYATIAIGTPAQFFTVIVDTG